MTTKEQIEVMDAFDRGEEIQCRATGFKDDWSIVKDPKWDWLHCEYRVKPQPEYVPFTREEAIEKLLRAKVYYKKQTEIVFVITKVDFRETQCIVVNDIYHTLQEMVDDFKFTDGTPCGKLK